MDERNQDPGKREEERQVYRAHSGHEKTGGRIHRRTSQDAAETKKPKAGKKMPSAADRFDPQAKTGPENWLLNEQPKQKNLFEEEPPRPQAAGRGNLFEDFGQEGQNGNLFEDFANEPKPNRQPSVWELGLGEEQEENFSPKEKKKRGKKAKKPKKAKRDKLKRVGGFLKKQRERFPKKERPRWRDLSWKRRGLKALKWGSICLAALLLVSSVLLGIFWNSSTKNDDLWLDLNQIPYKTETVLYYTDQQTGETGVYATLPCTQNKEYVEGSLMPQYLRDAFVAVEDQKFYKHGGVDIKRTIFALLNEVKYRLSGSYIGGDTGRKQGASTINQQLVKNLTRDDEDSNMAGYLRKLREIYRAWTLDRDYSKDEILSAYLNTISFTGNTAGVQAEAKKLFGKPVEELSLAESASLAAITRNPSRYNPVTNPEDHLERRNYVLGEMLDQGYIDEAQYNEAVATPLEVTGDKDPVREQEVTSYFTDAVMDEVVDQLVNERGLSRKEANNLLYNGGLRIYTTVVPELQEAMEDEMTSARSYPRPHHTVQGPLVDDDGDPVLDDDGEAVIGDVEEYAQAAMVSLNYEGGVCAVVGGLGEKEISRGFNRGMDAVRQVGSTMKGIAPYPLAIEDNDITWSTAFLDKPVDRVENEETGEMEDWPANVDRIYSEDEILVREAFARSVNTIAVRVGEEVGNFRMYNFVKNSLEIPTFVFRDNKPGPLVLGSSTYGITPVEMAKAYAMNGNGGYVPTIHTYTQITNGTGEVLLERETQMEQVIGENTSYIMNRLMREVMVGDGTASGMSVPGEMDSVGKTGTTSDHRDHWFIGLTPYYVTASWYGYDDNTPLDVSYRNHPPTAAWRNVMAEGQQELEYREFPQAAGVTEESYCTVSGYAAGPNCPSDEGYYKDDNPPRSGCPVHG